MGLRTASRKTPVGGSRPGSPAPAVDEIDLWAPVPKDALPGALLEALERRNWADVRAHLSDLMDGITTDGAYGRALLQVALELPLGVDPTFDSYRAAASIDHGDWDGLRRCLAHTPVEPVQLLGMRDVLLAPLSSNQLAANAWDMPWAMLFAPYEYQLGQMLGRYRRWARAMLSFQANEVIWSRPDVPAGRHFRYRRLQDVVLLAVGEAQAGRLRTALGLTLEARNLGDPSEPMRRYASDIEDLVAFALGDDRVPSLRVLAEIATPTGLSPLGAWQVLMHLIPFIALVGGDQFLKSGRLVERVAARLGSPRAQLASHSWRAAAEQCQRPSIPHPELPGLRAQAGRAGIGLRVLPQLLTSLISRRPEDFLLTEQLARRAGNVWAQVSALAWVSATNPSPQSARSLARLLEITDWRKLVLVPPEVAADAALGLASLGLRGHAIVELASAAGRPNVLLDVALRHIDDTAAPLQSRLVAVESLGTLGTTRAGEILSRLGRRNDELGRRARLVGQRRRRGIGLSEREVEVVRLAADGLTNREIADRLVLSQHTIARHLANARAKLGAANRTEAAIKVEEREAEPNGVNPGA